MGDRPMQVAQAAYAPKALVTDYITPRQQFESVPLGADGGGCCGKLECLEAKSRGPKRAARALGRACRGIKLLLQNAFLRSDPGTRKTGQLSAFLQEATELT